MVYADNYSIHQSWHLWPQHFFNSDRLDRCKTCITPSCNFLFDDPTFLNKKQWSSNLGSKQLTSGFFKMCIIMFRLNTGQVWELSSTNTLCGPTSLICPKLKEKLLLKLQVTKFSMFKVTLTSSMSSPDATFRAW